MGGFKVAEQPEVKEVGEGGAEEAGVEDGEPTLQGMMRKFCGKPMARSWIATGSKRSAPKMRFRVVMVSGL